MLLVSNCVTYVLIQMTSHRYKCPVSNCSTACRTPQEFQRHICTRKHRYGALTMDYVCPIETCNISFTRRPLVDVAQHIANHTQRHGSFGKPLKTCDADADGIFDDVADEVTLTHWRRLWLEVIYVNRLQTLIHFKLILPMGKFRPIIWISGTRLQKVLMKIAHQTTVNHIHCLMLNRMRQSPIWTCTVKKP